MNATSKAYKIKKDHLPIMRQAQFSECGHVCISMISRYHGHKIDLHALRQLHEPGIEGANLLDLMHILEALRFITRAISVDLKALYHVQCPAIIHWNMNHFVVLKSIHSHYVIIHDPAYGRRKVFFDELSKSFTGIVLEVEKAVDFKIITSSNRLSLRQLFENIYGLKTSLFILLIFSLAIEIFTLINPIFLQYIVDNVIETSSMNNLYIVAFVFIVLTLCHSLIDYVRSHFVLVLTNHLSEYFSTGVMNHLLKLPFDYFEKRHKGEILSRFYSIHEIQNKLTTDSINALLDGLVILFALMIMAIFSLQLTGFVVLALVIYFLLRLISYQNLKDQSQISIAEHANLNTKFIEILQCILPIKLYAKEPSMYREWKNCFIRGMNANIKIAKLNILYNTANLLLFNIEHILVITFGTLLVMKNQYSIGMLLAFLVYRQTLVTKATSFMQKLFEYRLVYVQLERLADILLHPIELKEKENKVILPSSIEGDIKLQAISYKYSGRDKAVLNQFNYHIKKGEKIVIVGPSGVGKSTLLKIMLGLLRPSEGKILIDGRPLELIGIKNYRRLCASVMQEDNLISGSIFDNISFMDNTLDMDRVYQAAKTAQIHQDILKMAMTYETPIGDMGSSLSGGQKQRILLARALYKQPKILFLDEATSHLDVATEIEINKALKQLQITQVVIAHREESIRMADRIIDLGKLIDVDS